MARTGPGRTAPDSHNPDSADLKTQVERLKARSEELEQQIKTLRGHDEGDLRRHLDEYAGTTRGWFWETDSQLRFTYLSDNVYDITGVEPSWHYGKTRYEFGAPASVTKEDWDAHLGQIERLEPFRDFVYLRKGPKGDHWLNVSGRPYFSEAGKFLGYRGSAFDITDQVAERKNAEILLAAVENHGDPEAVWDADDRLVVVNRRFREVTRSVGEAATPGVHIEDFVRASVEAGFFPDADVDKEGWIKARLERFHRPGEPFEVRRPDGRWIIVTDQKLPEGGTLTSSKDITVRKRAEMQLAQKSAILEAALKTIPDGVQVIDDDANLVAWNDTLFDVMELDRESVMNAASPGKAFFEIIAKRGDYGPGDIDALVESRLQPLHNKKPVCFERQLSSGRWIECRGGPVKSGGYVAVYRDIDASKRMTERLKELASVDELTRVSNRRHFLEAAAVEIDRCRRYGRAHSVVMLDIDHFKTINDTHGHAAGDAVLRAVAAACRDCARETDRIGRLGGEEFAIMLPEAGARPAQKLAERIRQAIGRMVIDFNGEKIRVTSSFGVVTLGQHHKTLENVLEDADKALYEAKRTGRNRVVVSALTA